MHIIGDDLGREMWCPALPPDKASSYFESRSRYTKTIKSMGYDIVGDAYVGKEPTPIEKRVPRPDYKAALEKVIRTYTWKNDNER